MGTTSTMTLTTITTNTLTSSTITIPSKVLASFQYHELLARSISASQIEFFCEQLIIKIATLTQTGRSSFKYLDSDLQKMIITIEMTETTYDTFITLDVSNSLELLQVYYYGISFVPIQIYLNSSATIKAQESTLFQTNTYTTIGSLNIDGTNRDPL